MNIRGIELLRKLGLPGPRNEIIRKDISRINLNTLYNGATNGATILVFDNNEPINQNPLYERDVRKYKIAKEEYHKIRRELISELEKKGVKRKDMKFLTHQTYIPEDIWLSGRVGVNMEEDGFGDLFIDAVPYLRTGKKDMDPEVVYRCPIIGGRLFRSQEMFMRFNFWLPPNILSKLVSDVWRIPGNPNVDFEFYNGSNNPFYHDMFLAKGATIN